MSKEKENKSPLINFQIKGVEVVNCSFAMPPSLPLANNVTFSYNLKIENKLDHANKLILVITNVEVTTLEAPLVRLAEIGVACIFNVENYEEVISSDVEKKNFIVSERISEILNSISISTTRGVMSQEFKGTFLHTAILPIIDPKGFKKE